MLVFDNGVLSPACLLHLSACPQKPIHLRASIPRFHHLRLSVMCPESYLHFLIGFYHFSTRKCPCQFFSFIFRVIFQNDALIAPWVFPTAIMQSIFIRLVLSYKKSKRFAHSSSNTFRPLFICYTGKLTMGTQRIYPLRHLHGQSTA